MRTISGLEFTEEKDTETDPEKDTGGCDHSKIAVFIAPSDNERWYFLGRPQERIGCIFWITASILAFSSFESTLVKVLFLMGRVILVDWRCNIPGERPSCPNQSRLQKICSGVQTKDTPHVRHRSKSNSHTAPPATQTLLLAA